MTVSQKPRNRGIVNPFEVLALGAVSFLLVNSVYHLFFVEDLPQLTQIPTPQQEILSAEAPVASPEREIASEDSLPCLPAGIKGRENNASAPGVPCLVPQASSKAEATSSF